MLKRFIGFLLSLLCSVALAQTTTVTGTLVDPLGNTWSNATITPIFTNAPGIPGPYNWSGGVFNHLPATVITSSGGVYSFTLPSNTAIVPTGSTWVFNVCPNASLQCAVVNLSISGTTFDLGAAITSSGSFPSSLVIYTPISKAYNVNQIGNCPPINQSGLFYNTTNQTMNVCTSTGWEPFAAVGGFPVVTNPSGNQNIDQPTNTSFNVNTSGSGALEWNGVPVLTTTSGVLVDPTTSQTIVQPVNTNLNIQTSGTGSANLDGINIVTKQNTNQVFNACQYSGADIGAQINAADTAASGIAADIVVQCTGTVSTVPTISSLHRLILETPLTWSVAPVLSTNSQIIGNGAKAIQTVSILAAWITATSLSNLEIDNLWINNTSTPTVEGAAILSCSACINIVMKHNHTVGLGILLTLSTSPTYAGVNSSNINLNIYLEGNYVDGNEFGTSQASRAIDLAELQYAQNVTMIGNDIINGEYNLEWWGGNAAIEGLTLTNTRWAQNFSVAGGRAVNVVTGWWGSMGENITVTGVTADGCIDLCLDAESSSYIDFTGFTVHNGGPAPASGALGVFFASQHNTFGPGVVIEDNTTWNPLFAHNVGQDPTQARFITFHNINFICNDPANPCLMKFDSIGSLRFIDNTIYNSNMVFDNTNNSDYEISRNNFYMPISQSNTIIGIPGQVSAVSPYSRISDNMFNVNAYPAGAFAINATITDFNFSDRLYISGNKTQGFTSDAIFAANSANSGITPTFVFQNNVWGNNSVSHTLLGALGKWVGYDYDPTAAGIVVNGTSTGVTKTCTVLPTVVGGIVTGC